MRYALLFIIGWLTFNSLSAQRNVPVHWKYLNGQIDSSILRYLPEKIKGTNDLFFSKINAKGKIIGLNKLLDLKEVEWLVQKFRYVNQGIISTPLLRTFNEDLSPTILSFTQIQASYAW